jgi:phosphatidylglycerol:prolipoprotein diacylglycerol transferase
MRRLFYHCLGLLACAPCTLAAAVTDAPLPPAAQKYWVDNLNPFIIRFPASWPLPGIRWYGLAYVAGFLAASWLLWLYAKKDRYPLNADARSTLLMALILGVLVGGRLGYYLLYRPAEFFGHPTVLFRVWEGGMASHGGFIGGLLAMVWFSRTTGLSFARLADVVVTLAPPGILFGRLANFINGELWGKPATVAWAMIFPIRDGDSIVGYTEPRHPSQLYEAATEGLLLLIYTQWRFWSKPAPGRPGALPPGQLAGEYLIGYALVRIFCELFREPDGGTITLILGLSRGTFYSLFMIGAGLAMIWWARRPRVPLPNS